MQSNLFVFHPQIPPKTRILLSTIRIGIGYLKHSGPLEWTSCSAVTFIVDGHHKQSTESDFTNVRESDSPNGQTGGRMAIHDSASTGWR